MLEQPTLLTTDYLKSSYARCVPDSYFADGGYWLPPDPDADSARIALRLFPKLAAANPELVARARLSVVDHKPIDYALPRWRALSDVDRARRKAGAHRVYWACNDAGIEPHEFQWADMDYAVENLNRDKGAYFGWEMGLGKTLGACMVMDAWDVNFAFIGCPNAAKIDPWLQHLEQFTPWMKPIVMGNSAKARRLALTDCLRRMDDGEPTALICHYDALKLIEQEKPRNGGWKRYGRWDLKVGDEAHLFLKHDTQFTAAFRRLDAVGTLLLSGSVMSGAAEKLCVPWRIMQPRRYKSQWRDWNDRFFDVVDTDYGKVIVGPKQNRLNEFRAELGEVLTVRPAAQYLSVPEPRRIYKTRLTMLPEQRKAYKALANELLAELPDGEIVLTQEGAPLRTALRRVTGGVPGALCERCGGSGDECAYTLDDDGVARDIHRDCPQCAGAGHHGLISVKHDEAMADIKSAGDSQVLAFSWYRSTARELERRCLAANIPCGRIDGGVSNAERERIIELFKAGGYRVLVATIKTLSTAANLQNASVVQMLELSDDPIDNEQAVGRAVRQGQPAHVTVIEYGVGDSVDDLDVASNQLSKAELRRQVLGCV